MPLYRGYGVHALGFVHVTLLDRHARTGRRPPQSGLRQHTADSPVCTGLQRWCRLSPSAPAYNTATGSSVFSRGPLGRD